MRAEGSITKRRQNCYTISPSRTYSWSRFQEEYMVKIDRFAFSSLESVSDQIIKKNVKITIRKSESTSIATREISYTELNILYTLSGLP